VFAPTAAQTDFLEENGKRLRSLVEHSSDLLTLISGEGIIVYITPSVRRILGYSVDEFTGSDPFKHIHPEDHDRLAGEFRDLLARPGGSATSIYRISHRDGSWRWLEGIATNLLEDPAVGAIIANARDITEYKRVEGEIGKLNSELEDLVGKRTNQLQSANRELEAFGYSIAHDLRAPLRAIGGLSGILEETRSGQLGTDGRRLLSMIRGNVGKMETLIDDFLAFSKLSRLPTETHSVVNLRDMVDSVIAELRKQGAGNAAFEVAPLPVVACNEPMIRQVWHNLLSNALKFSRTRPAPEIAIACETDDEFHTFSIRDNGVGFDMRHAGKLFGLFQRLHTESEFEGSGVGLAIVQRIVHRHGGTTWASGKSGKGATFFFTLPRAGLLP
jgi:PAS domain S-box-containing protein